jgi:hypothetical protein
VRPALLEGQLREQLGHVLRLDASRIDALAGFSSVGVDSLMGLELRNRLESSLGLTLSASLLFTYPNLSSVRADLLREMSFSAGAHGAAPPAPAGDAPSGAEGSVDALTKDDLLALFDERTG